MAQRKPSRRHALVGGILLSAAIAVPSMAMAQEYPVRPITLIVPYAAGGATDVVLRGMAEVASKHLGQPIIVENKTGGAGTVGPATMAATAKPDGYTISQIPSTVFRFPLIQDVSWDSERDFTYIISLTGYTFGITTHVDSEFKTWKDVVAYAKANPGKVTYATIGPNSIPHLGTEQIAAVDGIKLRQVPFKGGAETNAAILGKHTMLQVESSAWKPLVQAGKLRLLMVWTAERVLDFPDVPTLKDLGYNTVMDSPWGIAGPKGMDEKIVAKLHDAFKKAIDDPGVVALLAKYDMTVNYKNSEDYRKFNKASTEETRLTMQKLGIGKSAKK